MHDKEEELDSEMHNEIWTQKVSAGEEDLDSYMHYWKKQIHMMGRFRAARCKGPEMQRDKTVTLKRMQKH